MPDTCQLWSENGFFYDSELTFADRAGFSARHLLRACVVKLGKEENFASARTAVDRHGMFGNRRPLDFLLELKHRCRFYRGDLVLLWHNHRFTDPKEREMYLTVVG